MEFEEISRRKEVSVGVQSILYQNDVAALKRALGAIACAAQLAKKSGLCERLEVFYGDCSPAPCLSDEVVAAFKQDYQDDFSFHYRFFEENLGSAAGHNRLSEQNHCDMMLIQNPDVIMAPDVVEHFLKAIHVDGVGMVEAKQLPIEHPKDYCRKTGETDWATTACALFPKKLFDEIGGFDAESFFLYCDDVDFSWRVRLCGMKVIFLAHAVVFHDKRLSQDGNWMPTAAECYYSVEAALFMKWKWSFSRETKKLLNIFSRSKDENLQKAARAFKERERQGQLPVQIDKKHCIGYVDENGFYTKHRFDIQ